MVERVVVDTSSETPNPSIEEEAREMGLIDEEGNSTEQNPERPEWLPEKFKSPEDLAKSYAELEARMSGKAPADTEDTVTDVEQASEKAGLDFDDVVGEYHANSGKLTQETLTKLEAAGMKQEHIAQYIEAQETAVYSSVGGQEFYKEMISWASDNLSDFEIQGYDQAVNFGSSKERMAAVAALKSRFEGSVGKEPERQVSGKAPSGSAEGSYQSWAQVQKDMSSPDYKTDPAFRARVERKMANSNLG